MMSIYRMRLLGGLWLLCGLAPAAMGALPSAQPGEYAVETRQRLSDWLLVQRLPADVDLMALSWRSAAEQARQQALRTEVQRALSGRFSGLAGVIADMPVTGRVAVPKADARWLQVNPSADPWLSPGDSVYVAARSTVVTVLLTTGHQCRVAHQPGADAATYLRACGVVSADRAWVVQPDGVVSSLGVAKWNERVQSAPAAGAWVWAPQWQEGITPALSEQVVSFLATQAMSPTSPTWSYQRQAKDVTLAADARDPAVVGNDWGVVGLLQTPTARMSPAGTMAISLSRQEPYSSLIIRLQPVDWLEVGFGYLSISDRMYGPQAWSGNQSYKDKSAHAKVRLLKESAWWPEVAVGWRDFLGTGMFSGEYLVASKRHGPWDVSLGLGFGYVGGRGDVRNPLGRLYDRFDTRPGAGTFSRSGGEVNGKTFFRGPAAFFGGVQYQLPWDKWVLKAEVEGNDYYQEPASRPIKQDVPVNLGLVYRPTSWLDVTLGVERGNMATLTVATHLPLDTFAVAKVLDARPVAVSPARPAQAAPVRDTVRDIEDQTRLNVRAIEQRGRAWSVVVSNPEMGYERPVVDKVAAVVHRDAPPDIDRIELRFDQRGVKVAQAVVDRDAWVKERTELVPPGQKVPVVGTQPVPPASAEPTAQQLYAKAPDRLDYGVGLGYRQGLGGPDAFVLFQLSAVLDASFKFREDTWLSGSLNVALLDNYDKFKSTSSSNLPRVRTYIREYLTTRDITLTNLQLTHMGRAGSDHFYLAYAGLLESMYAGAGLEYLYRPVNSPLAVGVDVNRVRQRAFEQDFGLRDYQVNTGHVTAYWDTGWHDVVAKLSGGQYLAGDKGVTVDVSRVFKNGVTMGAYATKTNVSAEQFGEGSFDKGVYVTIPFDAFMPRSGPSMAAIVYAPLLRDGGASLSRRFWLYDLTNTRNPRALQFGAP